jgi:hypothetical protein
MIQKVCTATGILYAKMDLREEAECADDLRLW